MIKTSNGFEEQKRVRKKDSQKEIEGTKRKFKLDFLEREQVVRDQGALQRAGHVGGDRPVTDLPPTSTTRKRENIKCKENSDLPGT